MTTFEHGKAPAWACATWECNDQRGRTVAIWRSGEACVVVDWDYRDILCRALSLAKLAEDYTKAVDSLCHQALSDAADAIIKAVKE